LQYFGFFLVSSAILSSFSFSPFVMAEFKQKFAQLCKLKFKDQAVWFLNGFWGDGVDGQTSNEVWVYVRKFVELSLLGPDRKGDEGGELDQFWSAKFLEDMDSAMPAIARKEAFRTIDQDSNGKMSAIEYLIWKYKKGVKETVEAPQGDNKEAIRKAQEALDAVIRQMADCEAKIEAQKKAKQHNDKAKQETDKLKQENDKAIAVLRSAEQELHKAEKELEVAIRDLKQQEDDYNEKCRTLEATSKDQSASIIQRNKAANELAQLKQENPLPLRKAKLTQEAALRKVQKQKKDTEDARAVCESKGRELEKAIKELESAIKELERAIQELEAAYTKLEQNMAEAQAELEKVKSRPGGGKGAIWWLQRELFELDGRLPKAKQKFDHTKPFTCNL